MAEIFWPPYLPDRPDAEGYSHSTGGNVVRSEMELGPAKVRRRSSCAMGQLTCTYTLDRLHVDAGGETRDQYGIFLRFVEQSEGMSFWLPDPLNPSEEIKVRIKPQSADKGVTLKPLNALADIWQVTLDMEVWPLARRPRA